jgi:elongation factor P
VPAISTNDLKNGVSLNIDNTLYTVVEFQHVKPGKGGAFVRTKLRNLRTGNMLERTFNAGIKVEQAILDKRDMQFLYKDGDDYVFMDNVTYDQLTIKPVALGDAADYLIENAIAMIASYGDEIVSVEIPPSVELEIAFTEPGMQGDRVSGARKPATLQTGKVIQVPLTDFAKEFIEKYGVKDKSQYVLPIINDEMSEAEKDDRKRTFNRFINQHLKNLAKANGLTEDISTYWARHSFATTAVRKSASMEYVSEALGHSDLKTTKNYFAGFEDKTKREILYDITDFMREI